MFFAVIIVGPIVISILGTIQEGYAQLIAIQIMFGSLFSLFVILMISTGFLFVVKMSKVVDLLEIIDNDNYTLIKQAENTLEIHTKSVAICISISIMHTVIMIYQTAVDGGDDVLYYAHLIIWPIDVYVNTICTILTYPGVMLFPFSNSVNNGLLLYELSK